MPEARCQRYFPLILVAVISSLVTSSIFITLDRMRERAPTATPPQLSTVSAKAAAVGSNALIAARRMVEPAVVYIDVQSMQRAPAFGGSDNSPFLAPFREFLVPRPVQGTGSGFIFRSDGYILTNNHVIEGAQKLRVTLTDKRKFPARIVGVDPKLDLAVIKIDTKGLPTVVLGDSDRLEPGQWVLAIGNPLGYHQTVTAGIVSALNRSLEDPDQFGYLIQTDAAINYGNSGGPLIDLSGRVVGINVAIRADAQGVGFAIPINMAGRKLDDLISGRPPEKQPWIGIAMSDLSQLSAEIRREYNLQGTRGVVVMDVAPGSPAEKAGLQPLDIIVSVDRRAVWTGKEVQAFVGNTKVGQTIALLIKRAGQFKIVRIKLGAKPEGYAD